jgi:hypothetical protein
MIQPEVAAHFEGPRSLIVGSVDGNGAPDATRGWGAAVLDTGRLRILVPAAARGTLANLAHGGRLAVTATDVVTAKSIQVKGHAGAPESPTADDVRRFEQYVAGFLTAVAESDGTPMELLERMRPHRCVALDVTVEECFDQTPGPAAGRALAPAGP